MKRLRFPAIAAVIMAPILAFILTTSGLARAPLSAAGAPAPHGGGLFYDSGQSLGNANSHGVALGDLNGDGYPDAVVANSDGLNQVWLNDGAGQFAAGQAFEAGAGRGVALGDLNGNGDLDAIFANNGSNTVWFNDGDANFSDSGQSLGAANSYGVALADLDGDGSLDAFFANNGADDVWFNDGDGAFSDGGQALDSGWSYGAALGDLTESNGPDAFVAGWFPHANLVWLNDGATGFASNGQDLGDEASLGVALGDVNGNGALDAVVGNNFPDGVQVWVNDGAGQFSNSGQTLGDTTTYGVALADLDGDGDLDLFAANFGPNTVWWNGPPGLPAAAFDVQRGPHDEGGEVTYWSGGGDAQLPVLLAQPAPSALDVHVTLEDAGGTATQIMPFAPGEQLKLLQVTNPRPDPSAEAELTLSVTPSGALPGPGDVTDRLKLVFVDDGQGMKGCILCFVEWLGRLVGVDSAFGAMHHMELDEQEDSPQWGYYTGLFGLYAPEMADIVARNPLLLWRAVNTLDDWTPAVQSLGEGTGDAYTIDAGMVDGAQALLDGVQDKAGPGLQALLQQERAALDLDSFAGLTMDQGWATFQERRPIEALYFSIIRRSP
jgi:hypothetical protein